MIRSLLWVVFVLLGAGLPACARSPGSDMGPAEREHAVRLVFYDFQDERVTLSINGTLIVDQTMASTHASSTGLNEIVQSTLTDDNLFVLRWGGREVQMTVHADPDTRIVYITPGVEPNIWTSESGAVQLD